jgi:hypothetical protein
MHSEKTNSTFHWLQIRILKFRVEYIVFWRVEIVVLDVVHIVVSYLNALKSELLWRHILR